MWPDEHSISTRFIGRLYDKLVEILQHMIAILRIVTDECRHIADDRILIQVILDDLFDVGVDDFVVSNTSARCIRQSHATATINVEQSWDAQHRICSKHHGVKEI